MMSERQKRKLCRGSSSGSATFQTAEWWQWQNAPSDRSSHRPSPLQTTSLAVAVAVVGAEAAPLAP